MGEGLTATSPAAGDRASPAIGDGPPVAWRWILGFAALKVGVHVAVSDRYGWQRDELYYLASGRHPAAGYVDYPPLTPLLGRLESLVFGESLMGFRVVPALAGGAIVILVALMARELGGGRIAQIFAALLAVHSPMLLGANTLMQTVSLDQLWWALLLYLLLRLARSANPRLWLVIGIVAGVALETKYTVVSLGLGIVAGVVLTHRRRDLRTPWPWLGVATAAVIIAPNLVWQAQNGWPSLAYIANHQQDIRQEYSAGRLLAEVLLLLGPLTVVIEAAGLWLLLRARRYRIAGVAVLVTTMALIVPGTKSYYLAPLFSVLYAAGAVMLEMFLSRRTRRWPSAAIAAVIVLDAVIPLPIGLPVLPAATMASIHLGDLRQDYRDEIGWPELVDTVAAAYETVPAGERRTTTLLAENYGEAGAIDLFGPARGLPAAVSGHLTYWFWKPLHAGGGYVVVVGFSHDFVTSTFDSCREAGTISNTLGVANEEVGRKVYVCRDPGDVIDNRWRTFQQFR